MNKQSDVYRVVGVLGQGSTANLNLANHKNAKPSMAQPGKTQREE